LLASAGLILALPPFPTGLSAIFTWVPFFLFMKDKGFGIVFRGAYLVGFLWIVGILYWIGWATVVGFIGILIIWPLYFSFFAIVQSWLWKNWGEKALFFAPFIWTGIEICTSLGVLAFPWISMAYTQTYQPVFLQFTSITGMYGATFLLILLNVLFYFIIVKRRQKKIATLIFIVALLFIFLPLVYGKILFSKYKQPDEKISLSLVQGNIDPYKKWTRSFIDSNFTMRN